MAFVSLTQLADEEGSDKGTLGPGPAWRAHNYTDVYDAFLRPFRHQPITFLEIGLGVPGPNWNSKIARGRNSAGGASMRMWYRYFTRARILGIDVNPAGHLANDRVETFVVDQGDQGALLEFADRAGVDFFDVIIDDGSHRADHQQVSLSALFPRLRPGGLYFIEDLADNGLGDGRTGRSAVDHVLNTRRVLRGYADHAGFPEPHGLEDPDRLSRLIETVSFYCPRVVMERGGGLRARLPGRQGWRPRFLAGKEELCVLRRTERSPEP